jgi:hypothetical protein
MSDNFNALAYLGQHKNVSNGVLKQTACMGEFQRLTVADLVSIKKILPKLEQEAELTDEELIDVAIEIVSNEGYALWVRDTISDMAIKKGDTTKRDKWSFKTKTIEVKDSDANNSE